jgi:hypothetical protein
VPLEGHWARQNAPFTPTSSREWRGLLVGAFVAALVTIAVAWAIASDSRPAPAPGCRHVVVATSTGGATIERCP